MGRNTTLRFCTKSVLRKISKFYFQKIFALEKLNIEYIYKLKSLQSLLADLSECQIEIISQIRQIFSDNYSIFESFSITIATNSENAVKEASINPTDLKGTILIIIINGEAYGRAIEQRKRVKNILNGLKSVI